MLVSYIQATEEVQNSKACEKPSIYIPSKMPKLTLKFSIDDHFESPLIPNMNKTQMSFTDLQTYFGAYEERLH